MKGARITQPIGKKFAQLTAILSIPHLEIAGCLVGVVALLLAAVADLGDVERLLGVLALEVVLPLAKLSAFLSLYLSNRDFRLRLKFRL